MSVRLWERLAAAIGIAIEDRSHILRFCAAVAGIVNGSTELNFSLEV
jgi:hypothetical protein